MVGNAPKQEGHAEDSKKGAEQRGGHSGESWDLRVLSACKPEVSTGHSPWRLARGGAPYFY